MGYFYYSLSIIILIIVTILYFTRTHWTARLSALPIKIPYLYTAVPLSSTDADDTPGTFRDDAAAGLHSSTFDLSGNIESGDSRRGLDERGKKEVQRLMKSRGLTFDEARRQIMLERFKKQGVGEDGRPRDPKFVSFS